MVAAYSINNLSDLSNELLKAKKSAIISTVFHDHKTVRYYIARYHFLQRRKSQLMQGD